MSATSLFRDYLPVPSPASRSSPSSRPVSSIASHRILRARALARSPPRTSPPSVVHRAPASSVAPSRSRRRARSRRLCSPIERPRSSLESRRARAALVALFLDAFAVGARRRRRPRRRRDHPIESIEEVTTTTTMTTTTTRGATRARDRACMRHAWVGLEDVCVWTRGS